MSLRIAIAGTGNMAAMHARAIRAQEGVEMSAVCGHSRESLRRFAAAFDVPRAYDSLSDLLSMRAADALVIATPTYLHAAQVTAAMQAGLHVLVERPLGLNLAQARAIEEAGQFSSARLMVAQVYRFNPQVIWLREQVASGRLGQIQRARALGVRTGGPPGGRWYREKCCSGGGVLFEAGLDALDTLRFILGCPKPVSVYARVTHGSNGSPVEECAQMTIQWEDGTFASLEAGWNQPYAEAPVGFTQVYGDEDYGQIFPAFVIVRDGDGRKLRDAPDWPPDELHPSQETFDRQMAHFVQSIALQRSPQPGACEGVMNHQILEAACASARSGQVGKVRVKT
jgi:predicted dehydrogenase